MSAVSHAPTAPGTATTTTTTTTTTKPSERAFRAVSIPMLQVFLYTTTVLIVGIFLFTLPGSPFSMTRRDFRVQNNDGATEAYALVSPAPGSTGRSDLPAGAWLSLVPDSTRLTDVNLPGTHDSTARFGGDSYVCQTLRLADQLSIGVRFLDIRLVLRDGVLSCQHGRVAQNLDFRGVLDAVGTFLGANPGEFVVLKLQQEHTRYSATDFAEAVISSLDAAAVAGGGPSLYSGPSAIDGPAGVPTVGQLRGRVLVVPRGFTLRGYNTVAYEAMTAQDAFKVDLAAKSGAIATFYRDIPSDVADTTFSSGSIPRRSNDFDVAAGVGHLDDEDDDDDDDEESPTRMMEKRYRRSTRHRTSNLARPGSKGDDNEEVSLGINWYINYFSLHNDVQSPRAAAAALNPLLTDLLSDSADVSISSSTATISSSSAAAVVMGEERHRPKTRRSTSSSSSSSATMVKKFGVVMMDFIPVEAAQRIIESNF